MEYIIEKSLLPSIKDPNALTAQIKSNVSNLWNYRFLDEIVNISLKEIYDKYESFEIDYKKASVYLRSLKELIENEIKDLLNIMSDLKRTLITSGIKEQIDEIVKKAVEKIPEKPPVRKRKNFGVFDVSKSNVKVKDIKKFVEMHEAGLIISSPEMVNNIYFIVRGLRVELLEHYYHNIGKYVISFKWKTIE